MFPLQDERSRVPGGIKVNPGNLVRFKYDGYDKSYGIGIVIEINYDLGDGTVNAYALFNGERLMIRSEEVTVVQ